MNYEKQWSDRSQLFKSSFVEYIDSGDQFLFEERNWKHMREKHRQSERRKGKKSKKNTFISWTRCASAHYHFLIHFHHSLLLFHCNSSNFTHLACSTNNSILSHARLSLLAYSAAFLRHPSSQKQQICANRSRHVQQEKWSRGRWRHGRSNFTWRFICESIHGNNIQHAMHSRLAVSNN